MDCELSLFIITIFSNTEIMTQRELLLVFRLSFQLYQTLAILRT